jgi:hypothetical protein
VRAVYKKPEELIRENSRLKQRPQHLILRVPHQQCGEEQTRQVAAAKFHSFSGNGPILKIPCCPHKDLVFVGANDAAICGESKLWHG